MLEKRIIMIHSVEQTKKRTTVASNKVRSYNEIVEYLESLKAFDYSEAAIERMKKLDLLCNKVSTKMDIVVVGGTNGKSSTIHFAAKLLREEGFKVGSSFSSHLLTPNERIASDIQNTITNKQLTDIANDLINLTEEHNIKATCFELLTMAALVYFAQEKMDLALLEVGYGGKFDATMAFQAKIVAITRIAEDHVGLLSKDLDVVALEMVDLARSGTWLISGEQSKLRLQKMKTYGESKGILWAMPVRKLASLPYIFEQLYGRIASLGERIAQIYIEEIKKQFSPFLRGNLLATQKGQRGRPTLEAKRHAELNPLKTLKSFWTEKFDLLRGRFELLDKEKPSLLLDNSSNLDAFTNLFLGIRLLHYQKPLKGLTLLMGISKTVDPTEAIKLARYLLKKVSGQLYFVALPADIPSHNPQDLAAIAKDLNIKAKSCASFVEAYEQAKASVDEREGLLVISGSHSIVSEYWKNRGIKRF